MTVSAVLLNCLIFTAEIGGSLLIAGAGLAGLALFSIRQDGKHQEPSE